MDFYFNIKVDKSHEHHKTTMPYEQNIALMRCRGVHRVTDLEKCPVRISKDEAPTPLPVVEPLFISPCYFIFLEPS